ncbi:MAG: histidine kinase [Thermaurantimonas sp.]
MKIKRWVHLIFWSLFIIPSFIHSLFQVSKYKSIFFFALGVLSYLIVMFLAFYPISEYIAPRLVRNLKNWKMWLLLLSHIAIMAAIHMGVEYLIIEYALFKSDLDQPEYIDYFMGMLWFVFLASSVYILLEWYELQLQQTQLRQFLAQTELEKKRFQLNPHFLFNIFNSIYALSIKKSEDLPDIILKLSELMRYILDQNQTYNSIGE